ncbi:MAG: hypothetical protein V7L27_33130 [Nostoc sp.]|uniref:hypothetical protein n=1 Tax=Nostoc sp. TaxID=1180 RepID=UPI002FFBF09B
MTRYQPQREAIRHRPTLLIKLRLIPLVGQFRRSMTRYRFAIIAQNSSHTSLRVGCGASSALAKARPSLSITAF